MAKAKQTFKQQLAELEAIIKKFETEEWNLDDGLEEFEKALQLAEQLKKTIRSAENKVEELQRKYSADV